MPLTDLEKRALDAVDMDALLAFLSDLVAVPSINGSPAESDAQKLVADLLRSWDFDLDCWEIDFDELRKHPAYSVETERQSGLGVVGYIGAGRGRSLILNGHVDVVPVDDQTLWHYPPWTGTLAGDRMYGRGALDMKGGLCCGLFAARALQQAGVRLDGRLILQSVIGEEDGGAGTLAAIQRGYRADGAIIMEPTELCTSPSQAGALNFRITIPGRTAHGALRGEGVSAIDKFIPIYQALMAFEAERQRRFEEPLYERYAIPFALNVGTVRAGQWASNVPESLTLEGRFGIVPGEDVDLAREAFEQVLHTVSQEDDWLRKHSPELTWWGAQFLPARIPIYEPILRTAGAAFEDVTGQAPQTYGMTYGADMRLLVNQANTPTLLFGPGDIRNAHRPDEFVPVSDLETVTRTLVLTAMRFCGV